MGTLRLTSLRRLTTIFEFMEVRFLALISILVLTAGLTGCQSKSEDAASRPASAAAVAASASRPTAAPKGDKCLDCHGPFDKLIQVSASYVAPSKEKTSPHRYVPHDSKLEKDIPECSHCHTSHPVDTVPAKGSIDLSKVGVQWCYDSCHHEKTLKSCKECHP
jgi:hypothetical protein